MPNEALTPSTPEANEFDQFYVDAVACGFLLDIPKTISQSKEEKLSSKLIELLLAVLDSYALATGKTEYEEQLLISKN
jgi:hypothetical protein